MKVDILSMSQTDIYLKSAVAAAKKFAPIFKKYFGCPKTVSIKHGDPHDLVTEIDRRIETGIRKYILQKFPTHKIIGEEFGASALGKNDIVWIIDPIDGTTNYIQGLPFACISIGLWDAKGPLVGVVYNPILKELYTAQRDKGAFLNGKKLQVSKISKFGTAYGGFGWGRDITIAIKSFPVVISNTKKIRTLGSSTLEICLIARGVYDFLIQKRINVWDYAAAVLILTEAGGKTTDTKGQNLNLQSTSILGTNGKIHKEILQVIKKLGD